MTPAGVVLGRMRQTPTGSAVRFELRFPADPVAVWSALVTPERVARWLAAIDGDRRPGGTVRLLFGLDAVVLLTVLNCLPGRRLDLDYRFPDGTGSRLRVEVHADGEGAILVLDHGGFPDSPAPYGAAWQDGLNRLGAELAGRLPASGAGSVPLTMLYEAAWARMMAI